LNCNLHRIPTFSKSITCALLHKFFSMEKSQKEVYYKSYLALDQILNAQHLESEKAGKPADDEMLFIIIHQTY